MKKAVLGGIVSVLLIVTAVLAMYLLVAKSTSSFRLQEFDTTVAFMADRIDALEKQRDLLRSSAAAMEKEVGVLNKRVRQIDVEIQSMKDLVGSAKTSIKDPLFSWNGLRITAGSSVMMIAFLALIWLLYSAFIKSGTSGEDSDDDLSPLPDADSEVGAEPLPGSVLEEEYPLPSETAGAEIEPAEDESPVDEEGLTESEAKIEAKTAEAVEPEEIADGPELSADSESPSTEDEPDEVKK
jgi:outer membrane murein-binding lipoprotein Lpp